MHVHRFERAWLAASLALIVLFITTIAYGAVGVGFGLVDDEGGQVDPDNPAASENFREPGVYAGDEDDQYHVYIEAWRFQFTPGTSEPIRVPAGSTVTFHVTSTDVLHGFQVVGTNVNTMVTPGQVATVTVEFEDPGEYGIVCNEYCGAGHHGMEGTLEVVPRSEWNGTGSTGNGGT